MKKEALLQKAKFYYVMNGSDPDCLTDYPWLDNSIIRLGKCKKCKYYDPIFPNDPTPLCDCKNTKEKVYFLGYCISWLDK
jgi:hypothetical protein